MQYSSERRAPRRSLTFKRAVRAPYEDSVVTFAPRPEVDGPLRAYELDPNLIGAARVVETAATVFLTGIQARRQ